MKIKKAKPPIMCPYCHRGVKRVPFGDSIAFDNAQFYYIRMEEDPSVIQGNIQRWDCLADKKHVFYHSTDQD